MAYCTNGKVGIKSKPECIIFCASVEDVIAEIRLIYANESI